MIDIADFYKMPSGLTRRKLLQGLGLAMAGAGLGPMRSAASPTPAQSLGVAGSPELIFNLPLTDFNNNSITVLAPAAYQNGMMFFRTTARDSNNNVYNDVQFVDVQNQTAAFSLLNFFSSGQLPTTPFAVPVVNSTTLYTATGSTIYEVDVSGQFALTWSPLSSPIVSDLLLIDNNLVFATADGTIWICSTAYRQPINHIATHAAGASVSLTSSGSSLYAQGGGVLSLVDYSGLAEIKSVPVSPGGMTVGGGSIYLSGSDSFVRAHDPATGNQVWQYPADPTTPLTGPLTPPIYVNNQVVFADSAGILHIIGALDGVQSWQNALGSGLGTPSFFDVEDGAVFVSYGESRSLAIFAVDLTSQQSTEYQCNSVGTCIGVENGMTYFSHNQGQNVAAIDMIGVLHGFYCESSLIEDYVPDSNGNVTHNPSFQSIVKLFDPNSNPRIDKAIKIWASDSVTITVNNSAYGIDPDTSVWINTDGAGELTIVVSPDSITCPALYLWGTFMYPEEAIIIYPDHLTANKLAALPDNAFDGAKDYNNQNLLPDNYTGGTALVTSIRNTMGAVSQSVTLAQPLTGGSSARNTQRRTGHRTARKRELAAGGVRYVAFPSSTPIMVYQSDNTQPVPTRLYTPQTQAPNWTLELSPTGAIYTPQTGDLSASVASAASMSWQELTRRVVHGADNIAKTVVTTVDKEVSHLITIAGNTFKVIVDSLEAAAAVVASVLKSVIGDIKRAVQWLAYVFDWKAILSTKTKIEDTVKGHLANFTGWIDAKAQAGVADIHTFFQNAISQVDSVFDNFLKDNGGSSLQSQQVNNNDPSSTYGHGGANSYAQTNWMSSKVKDNVANGQDVSTGLTAAADVEVAIQNVITGFENAIKSGIAPNFSSDLKKALDSFGHLILTNPTKFVTHLFSEIIAIVRDVVVSMLRIIDAALESLLGNLKAIIDGGLALIQSPIKIPIIDEIWKIVSGSQLTLLDLFSLIIAIPSSIVSRIVSNPDPSGNVSAAAADTLLGYCQVFSGAVNGIFDSLGDLDDAKTFSVEMKMGLALSIIVFGLGFPSNLPDNTPFTYTFYALSSLPIAMSVVDALSKREGSSVKEAWSTYGAAANVIYGLVMVFMSTVQASSSPQFKWLPTILNYFDAIPYLGKAFADGPAGCPARIGASIIDGVCDFSAAGISGAITWAS